MTTTAASTTVGDEARATAARLPVRFLLAEAADDPVGLVGLVAGGTLVVGGSETELLDGWWGVVLGVAVVGRVLAPLYTWLTFRFAITSGGLMVSRGLVTRRVRSMAWSSVSAVEVDTPSVHGVLDLSVVTIVQSGDDAADLRIPGVRRATARRLAALAGARPPDSDAQAPAPDARAPAPDPQAPDPGPRVPALEPEADPEAPDPAPAVGESDARPAVRAPDGSTSTDGAGAARPTSPVVVHRATVGDLLLTSLVHGRAATLGAAGLLALLDGLDGLGVSGLVGRVVVDHPRVAGLALTAAVVAIGAVATVMRYWGLRTEVSEEHLIITHGLVTTHERVVASGTVVGVEFRQNIIEMALGRVRLLLITTDAAAGLGTNLVLPSVREPVADAVVATSLPQRFARPASRRPRRWRAVGRAAVAALVVGVVAVAAAVGVAGGLGAGAVAGVATFLAALGLLHWLGGVASCRIAVAHDVIDVSTAHLSQRRRLLEASAVHHVTTTEVGGHVVLARLNFFAGRPRRVTSVRTGAEQARLLARAVTPDRVGTAR